MIYALSYYYILYVWKSDACMHTSVSGNSVKPAGNVCSGHSTFTPPKMATPQRRYTVSNVTDEKLQLWEAKELVQGYGLDSHHLPESCDSCGGSSL